VSAAVLPAPTAIWREEQSFGWWVYALLALMAAFGLGLAWFQPDLPVPRSPAMRLEVPLGVAIGLVLPTVLVVGVLRMTTEVHPGELRVWFGWVPSFRHAIALDAVQRIEVVGYRPLRDCGGWGVRRGRGGERVLNARGDRGVRLHFADGSRVLVGSQRPEALAVALEGAMRPAG
jgi:hypothetical protein